MWWEKPDAATVQDGLGRYRRNIGPSSVEMAAYALLTYIELDEISKAKPIAMWLTETRGSSGGFYSTQVGLCDVGLVDAITICKERLSSISF